MDSETDNKKNLKNLIIRVHEDIHYELKVKASIKRVSISKYVTQAILEKMEREKRCQEDGDQWSPNPQK